MISRLFTEKRSSSSFSASNIPKHLEQIFGGSTTASGVSVNEQKALSLTAVWACISIISRTMATMPLPVYKRIDSKSKEVAYTHPLYEILHDNPNAEQTAYQWRSLMSVHMLLWGAGISEIEFNRKGEPVALWPIPPWRASPERTKSGSLVYKINTPDGKTRILQSTQVVVFASMSTTSDRWMSPIQVHRETLGAAMAVKEFGAKTFGQGINPAGILSGIKFGTEEHMKTLRDEFSRYEGLGNSHRLMFIEEGTEFKSVGLPPEDAQYLETRQMDVTEVGRMYNVPNFMLNLTDGSSNWGTGLEEQTSVFLTFTMQPYATMWEQECNKKLFFTPIYFPEFNMDALLRANMKARNEANWKRWQMGSINANEIRVKEGDNPLPDDQGTHFFVPMNMDTVENVIAGNNQKRDTTNKTNTETITKEVEDDDS